MHESGKWKPRRRQWHPTPVLLPGKFHERGFMGSQSMGLRRVGQKWVTSLSLFTYMHWRRKWQPTPMFLPGESQGCGSLVGCHLWVSQSRTRLKPLSSSSTLKCVLTIVGWSILLRVFFVWFCSSFLITCWSSYLFYPSLKVMYLSLQKLLLNFAFLPLIIFCFMYFGTCLKVYIYLQML